MTEEQRKAIDELIRVARVASFTARGLWYCCINNSPAEAALRDIEIRLSDASRALLVVLAEKDSRPELGEIVH